MGIIYSHIALGDSLGPVGPGPRAHSFVGPCGAPGPAGPILGDSFVGPGPIGPIHLLGLVGAIHLLAPVGPPLVSVAHGPIHIGSIWAHVSLCQSLQDSEPTPKRLDAILQGLARRWNKHGNYTSVDPKYELKGFNEGFHYACL